MIIKKIFLLCCFLFIAFISFSQVEIIGELKLGDTSQVHILSTTKGDRLVGQVIGFNSSEIQFLHLQQEIIFPIADVQKITVKYKDDPAIKMTEEALNNVVMESYGKNFQYSLTTVSGKIYQGIFRRLFYDEASFILSDGTDSIFQVADIQSITLLSEKITNDKNSKSPYHILKSELRGDKFKGQLIDYKNGKWQFEIYSGNTLAFPDNMVHSIEFVIGAGKSPTRITDLGEPKIHLGRYAAPMPTLTRNYLAPTGFLLEQGEVEYRNTQIFFNNVDFGISDHFNIGVGVFSLIFVNSLSAKAKLGASLNKYIHVSAGGQAAYIFGIENLSFSGSYTILNAAATLGTKEDNITIGVSRFNTNEDDRYNVISAAGSIRVAKYNRVFIEFNQFYEIEYDDNFSILNAGASWFKNGNRVDFGFAITNQEGDFVIPLPIAAYSRYF